MSLVKVIVPCYRYAHFLRECVESVLTQPGVEVRVLVLDDASPDDTPGVAAALAAQDPRVEYRRHAENRGHIATYNEGLEWATDGDYVVLLSADDLLTPGALRRATHLMDTAPEVGFVYGNALKFETGKPRPRPRLPDGDCQYRIQPGAEWLRSTCWAGVSGILSPEVVVRSSLHRRLGGYRAELPHTADQEMWMRLAAHAAVGRVLNADQAFYRLHPHNMHSQRFGSRLEQLKQGKGAFELLFQEYGDRIPDRAQLQYLSSRKYACAAMREIWQAYDRGEVSSTHTEELARFASSAFGRNYLDARFMWAFGNLQVRKLMGPRLSHWVASRVEALWGGARREG